MEKYYIDDEQTLVFLQNVKCVAQVAGYQVTIKFFNDEPVYLHFNTISRAKKALAEITEILITEEK